jgi:hypothetical protein
VNHTLQSRDLAANAIYVAYWQAFGGVSRDGAPSGMYQFRDNVGDGLVKFLLVLPGETIELDPGVFDLASKSASKRNGASKKAKQAAGPLNFRSSVNVQRGTFYHDVGNQSHDSD